MDGKLLLDFHRTSLQAFVEAMLDAAEPRGAKVTTDISTDISLKTVEPLPLDKALPAIRAVLRLYGAALRKEDDAYRIVAGAMPGTLTPDGPVSAPRRARLPPRPIWIFAPKQLSAFQLDRMIGPLSTGPAIVRADEAENIVILIGDENAVRPLLSVVETFDVQDLRDKALTLVPVKSKAVRRFLGDARAAVGALGNEAMARRLKLIGVESINAILAISSDPSDLTKVERWVERMDVGDDGVSRIYIYRCQNSRAKDLADVLMRVFVQKDRRQPPRARHAPSKGYADSLMSPKPEAPAVEAATAGGPGVDGEAPAGTPVAGAQGRLGDGAISGAYGSIRIIADEKRNAIVIHATRGDFEIVEAALKELDVVPLQVLLEATIAEVTLNDELRYGVDWFFKTKAGKVTQSFTLSSLDNGAVTSAFPGFSYVVQAFGGDVGLTLNALDAVTDVRVISSPTLSVLDNEQASLWIGDQVPTLTRTAQSVDNPNAPVVSSIEYKDTGVTLHVTPRVNDSGLVTLDIEQNVSDVQLTSTSSIDSPTIRQRKITSTVAVADGETLALGGLIRDLSESGTSGIPGLSHLPIIGSLFGTVSKAKGRTELLVLIKPRVIRSPQDGRNITEELRRRLRSVVPLEDRIR